MAATPQNSYYCGFCKGRHSRKETVQQCAIDYYLKTGKTVGVGLKSMGATIAVEAPSSFDGFRNKELPSGHYLIPVKSSDGSVVGVHAQLRRPNRGKWTGRYFINLWETGSSTPSALSDSKDREEVLNELKNGNWRRAMLDYGRTYGICPICENPLLSNELRKGVNSLSECYNVIYS